MTITENLPAAEDRRGWTTVAPIDRLVPGRGVAAVVDGHPVAVFVLPSGDVHAIDNIDPCSGASVLSRGIVGDVDGIATVASPMYKQRFALHSGQCLDADVEPVGVHEVRTIDGVLHVRLDP